MDAVTGLRTVSDSPQGEVIRCSVAVWWGQNVPRSPAAGPVLPPIAAQAVRFARFGQNSSVAGINLPAFVERAVGSRTAFFGRWCRRD